MCKETVRKLMELAERYAKNVEIQIQYAKGLVNLSNVQENIELKETVVKLGELAKKFSDNRIIIGEYVKGLINLNNKQK